MKIVWIINRPIIFIVFNISYFFSWECIVLISWVVVIYDYLLIIFWNQISKFAGNEWSLCILNRIFTLHLERGNIIVCCLWTNMFRDVFVLLKAIYRPQACRVISCWLRQIRCKCMITEWNRRNIKRIKWGNSVGTKKSDN